MWEAQCVASVGGGLKPVNKGVLHPEPTMGKNWTWQEAAEKYSLFCSEFHKGDPAHGACPCSLIFKNFSILTGIGINLINFELSPTAYNIRGDFTLQFEKIWHWRCLWEKKKNLL